MFRMKEHKIFYNPWGKLLYNRFHAEYRNKLMGEKMRNYQMGVNLNINFKMNKKGLYYPMVKLNSNRF